MPAPALPLTRLTLGGDFRASTSGWALPGAACVELGSGLTAVERGEDVAVSLSESEASPHPAQGCREQAPCKVGH